MSSRPQKSNKIININLKNADFISLNISI